MSSRRRLDCIKESGAIRLGPAAAKDAGASPFQLFAYGINVVDLEAEMMDRAARIFAQKFCDWGKRAERFGSVRPSA